MIKTQKNRAFNFFIYAILLLLAYIVQSTPIMLPISRVYPNIILAIVIIISMFETDFFSAVFGLLAGMLVDTISTNGSGFHALTYMITGFICSLLIEIFFQNNFASFTVISVPVIIIHQFIEIVTKGNINGGVLILFYTKYLLVAMYTFVVCFLIYLIFYYIVKKHTRFKKPTGILPIHKHKKQSKFK